MRSFRKLLALLLLLAWGGAAGPLPAEEPVKKDSDSSSASTDKTPDKKKSSDPKKDASKSKSKKKKTPPKSDPADPANSDAAADGRAKLALPLVEGHDSKGLKIPYYDQQGNLQMVFNIGVASRLDPDHVKMSETQVETYNNEGEAEMTIDLPISTLDLNTRVITSQTKTTIHRDDFKITGDAVAFDTIAKTGKLVGNVHMTIYDLEAEAGSPPSPRANE